MIFVGVSWCVLLWYPTAVFAVLKSFCQTRLRCKENYLADGRWQMGVGAAAEALIYFRFQFEPRHLVAYKIWDARRSSLRNQANRRNYF